MLNDICRFLCISLQLRFSDQKWRHVRIWIYIVSLILDRRNVIALWLWKMIFFQSVVPFILDTTATLEPTTQSPADTSTPQSTSNTATDINTTLTQPPALPDVTSPLNPVYNATTHLVTPQTAATNETVTNATEVPCIMTATGTYDVINLTETSQNLTVTPPAFYNVTNTTQMSQNGSTTIQTSQNGSTTSPVFHDVTNSTLISQNESTTSPGFRDVTNSTEPSENMSPGTVNPSVAPSVTTVRLCVWNVTTWSPVTRPTRSGPETPSERTTVLPSNGGMTSSTLDHTQDGMTPTYGGELQTSPFTTNAMTDDGTMTHDGTTTHGDIQSVTPGTSATWTDNG